MRDITRTSLFIVLALSGGCGDAPQPEPAPVTYVTSGAETSSPEVYGVGFTDVTEQTPTCFYFSGPGELGRDDQLGGSATLDETSLTFARGPVFVLDASGALVRVSSHDYDGTWTVHETITLTRSSESGFVGEYHYEEFEPGATSPGRCRIDARIVLGAPEVEPAVSEATRTCLRAVACCDAYFDAFDLDAAGVDPDVACSGVREAADAGVAGEPACRALLDGLTHSLTAMDMAIPQACR